MTPARDDLFIKATLQFAFLAPGPWYRKRDIIRAIVDVVAQQAIFGELKLAGPDEKLAPFDDVNAAKKLVSIGKSGTVKLQDAEDVHRKLLVRLAVRDDSLVLKIWCGGDALARQRETILDQVIAVAVGVRAVLAGQAGLQFGFAYPVHVRKNGFDYPRPRPPRRHGAIQIYSVLELIDLDFHRSSHAEAEATGAEALATSALPPFASRITEGGLVVIRWVTDAGDESQLARGASAHEAWLGEHLSTWIDGPYNELGDRKEARGAVEQRPPLTLYSPATRVGYKAVVVFPDGKVEDAAWKIAVTVASSKQLPDGTPVDQVKVVVPLRQLALQVRERALGEGIAAVLYPSDNGEFWDPDPPGAWATPPHPGAAPSGEPSA